MADLSLVIDKNHQDKITQVYKQVQFAAPLSATQRLMVAQSEQNGAYVEQYNWLFTQPVEPQTMQLAWRVLCYRHSIFRSCFVAIDGVYQYQLVLKDVNVAFEVVDLRDRDTQAQAIQVEQIAHRQAQQLLPLKAAPVMHVVLIQLADDQYRLLWQVHRALVDSHTVAMVYADIDAIYQQLKQNPEDDFNPSAPLENFYQDLAGQHQSDYWQQYLNQAPVGFALGCVVGEQQGGLFQHQSLNRKVNFGVNFSLNTDVESICFACWAYVLACFNCRSIPDASADGVLISLIKPLRQYKPHLATDLLGPLEAHLPLIVKPFSPQPLTRFVEQINNHSQNHIDHYGLFDTELMTALSQTEAALCVTVDPVLTHDLGICSGFYHYPLSLQVIVNQGVVEDIQLSFDASRYAGKLVDALIDSFGYVLAEVLADVQGGEVSDINQVGLFKGKSADSNNQLPQILAANGQQLPVNVWGRLDKQLAKLDSSGQLDIAGKIDEQIWLNQRPVNLSMIKQALKQAIPAAQDKFVVDVDDGFERRLTAVLRDKLPAHMVPQRLTVLEQLPLTRNGKIDRNGLKNYGQDHHQQTNSADHQAIFAVSDPVEQLLQTLWQQLLKRSSFKPDDDFTALGGRQIDRVILIQCLKQQLNLTGQDAEQLSQLSTFAQQCDLLKDYQLEGQQTASAPPMRYVDFAADEQVQASPDVIFWRDFLTEHQSQAVFSCDYRNQSDIAKGYQFHHCRLAVNDSVSPEVLLHGLIVLGAYRLNGGEIPAGLRLLKLAAIDAVTPEAFYHLATPQGTQAFEALTFSQFYQLVNLHQQQFTQQPSFESIDLTELAYSLDEFYPLAEVGISVSDTGNYYHGLNLQFNLNVVNDGEGLLSIHYRDDLFSPATIGCIADTIQYLAKQPLGDSISSANAVDWPPQIFQTLDDGQLLTLEDQGVHQYVEYYAEQQPAAVALIFDQQAVNYQSLNQAANQLARELIAVGLQSQMPVAVALPRGIEAIVAMIAICKAGGCYLPLELSNPQARLELILADCQVNWLICHASSPIKAIAEKLAIGIILPQQGADQSGDNLNLAIHAQQLAYIIYTSGSTGTPKGIGISHENIHSLLAGGFISKEVKTWLSTSSMAFDAFTFELWWPLSIGGSLLLIDLQNASLEQLGHRIKQHQIGGAWLTAGLYNQIIEQQWQILEPLNYLLVGGEALSVPHINMGLKHLTDTQLINGYGPSENTTFSSTYEITADDAKRHRIPIGQALAGRQCYVLDQQLNPVAVGMVGRLYLAGYGLAQGYYQQRALTAAGFIPNPFSQVPGARLYDSGDMVRWLPNGDLDYVRRGDDQVKIRGFRIELGEIERCLLLLAEIKQAVVLIERQSIMAFVVASGSDCSKQVVKEKAKQWLKQRLPAYMQPQQLLCLQQLPLTNNGKVDKRELLAMLADVRIENDGSQGIEAASNEIETALLNLFIEVLANQQIGVSHDFFALGGNSLMALKLLAKIHRQIQVKRKPDSPSLTVADLLAAPTVQQLASRLRGDFADVDGVADNADLTYASIVKAPKDCRLPLSFAQQRMWLIDQMQQGSSEYHLALQLEAQAGYNLVLAEQALNGMIARHQVLRTLVGSVADELYQLVLAQGRLEISSKDISQSPPDSTQQTELKRDFYRQPFDLQNQLPIRAMYLKQHRNGAGLLLICIHHIAADGWSLDIFAREFTQFYQQQHATLPQLRFNYGDYAYWQQQWLQSAQAKSQLDYWLAHLAALPQLHQLPTNSRPAVKSLQGAILAQAIPVKLFSQLTHLAHSLQMTPFMLFHGLFALLLSRHSGSNDVVVGSVVANRNNSELDDLIGFFVNTLVLRVNIGQHHLADFLAQVKAVNLAALANQQTPFELLVEKLGAGGAQGFNPLFQIMFTLTEFETTEFGAENFALSHQTDVLAKFDLGLDISVSGGHGAESGVESGAKSGVKSRAKDRVQISWLYDVALFEQAFIAQLHQRFLSLLHQVAGINPDVVNEIALSQLSVLSNQELAAVYQQPFLPRLPCLGEDDLVTLFANTVANHSGVIGLKDGKRSLTYAEIDQLSDQIAYQLCASGVKPGDRVGLCMARDVNLPLHIIAILKAGGAYVPLDSKNPSQRLRYLIQDANLRLIVSDESHQVLLQDSIAGLDCAMWLSQQQAKACQITLPAIAPQDLAYIIYTSGSTGLPKGVMVEHHSVVNLAFNIQSWLLERRSEVKGELWGWVVSAGFDSSIQGLSQFVCGRGLYVIDDEAKQQPDLLVNHLDELVVIDGTPSLLSLWFESDILLDSASTKLPNLVIGGEAVSEQLWQQMLEFQQQYQRFAINVYGPTECTVDATFAAVSGDISHIGGALDNYQLYILDQDLNLVPNGVAGELYIAGAGVARGYSGQGALTASRFIPNPYASNGCYSRMYASGDMVKRLDDGRLVYLGRNDNQVKIRGFRVDIGEVSLAANAIAGVEQAHSRVFAVDHSNQQDLRIGLYLKGSNLEFDEIKAQLGLNLPDYMLPSAIIVVDELPLTANGKIDFNALPAFDLDPLRVDDNPIDQRPTSETERQLAQLWQALLTIEQPSINADFFRLGGHSLLLARLLNRINQQFKRQLRLSDLVQNPTLSAQAKLIEQAKPIDQAKPIPQQRSNSYPLSINQRQLWIIDQMEQRSSHYNMLLNIGVTDSLDVALAEQALLLLIERHQILRTIYREAQQQPVAFVVDIAEVIDSHHWQLDCVDQPKSAKQISALIASKCHQSFDISQELPIRAGYVCCQQGTFAAQLYLVVHHIACDGWSMALLAEQFWQVYLILKQRGQTPQGQQFDLSPFSPSFLPPLALHYRDFAAWQLEAVQLSRKSQGLAYWFQHLQGISPVHHLPLDYQRPNQPSHKGNVLIKPITQPLLAQLEQLADAQQVSLFMLLQGAFSLLVARLGKHPDVVIGTVWANRLEAQFEDLIGYFANTVVLRLDCATPQSFSQFLAQVRQRHLEAQQYQDIPFEWLVEALSPKRSASYNPLIQLLFLYEPYDNNDFNSDYQILPEPPESVSAMMELTVTARGLAEGMGFEFLYNCDLFDLTTIETLADCYVNLLQGIVAGDNANQVPMQYLAIVQQSVAEQSAVKGLIPAGPAVKQCNNVAELVSLQANRTPDAIALVAGHQQVSYRALEWRANQLAAHLIDLGAAPEVRVALCYHRGYESGRQRGIDLIVAILAVLKTGACYVPLDPAYPQQRLRYLLEDSSATLLLSHAPLCDTLIKELNLVNSEIQLINTDELKDGHSQPAKVAIDRDNLLYLVYTSGSTGKPKGVAISQGNVLAMLAWAQSNSTATERAGVLFSTSVCFDLSIYEIFLPLTTGGCCVIAANGLALIELEQRPRVTMLNSVPSVATSLLEQNADLSDLKRINLAGEPLSQSVVERLYQHSKVERVFDLYGPSEDTTYSTCALRTSGGQANIGFTIDNTVAYVLDDNLQHLPPGVVGELYLAGDGVSRGYVNRPKLTAERYLPDPFVKHAHQGRRMYRTGDLVKIGSDGCLIYIGRIDFQVKLRGFRIELGEIEQLIAQHSAIKQAVVVVQDSQQPSAYLEAFIEQRPDLHFSNRYEKLRVYVQGSEQDEVKHLVEQVPVLADNDIQLLVVEDIPRDHDGQVMWPQLRAKAAAQSLVTEFVAPTNDFERAVCEIWAQLLGRNDGGEIGLNSDFFALGGHSLLATSMLNKVNTEFDSKVNLGQFIRQPLLADLCQLILASQQPVAEVMTVVATAEDDFDEDDADFEDGDFDVGDFEESDFDDGDFEHEGDFDDDDFDGEEFDQGEL